MREGSLAVPVSTQSRSVVVRKLIFLLGCIEQFQKHLPRIPIRGTEDFLVSRHAKTIPPSHGRLIGIYLSSIGLLLGHCSIPGCTDRNVFSG
jgi:hypothetical protein